MSLAALENKRILFAGGGTGGHIFPGIAVIEKLRRELGNVRFMWIGTAERIESEIIPQNDIPFKPIKIDYFKRGFSPSAIMQNLSVGANLVTFRSIREAGRIIVEYNPDVVVGLGSFVAGPVVIAASMRKIPTVLLELNAKPGLSTKLAAPSATKICLADPLAKQGLKRFRKKIVVTGCPIREEILSCDHETGIRKMGLDPKLKTIFVLGGSQGAQTINETFISAWELNVKRTHKKITGVQVIHQWGKKNFSATKSRIQPQSFRMNYHLFNFISNIAEAFASADLIISRAGATTIAEITAKGIPSILIPFPYAANNHQLMNAKSLEIKGAAKVIEEKYLSMDYLLREIYEILNDTRKHKAMSDAALSLGKPNATEDFIKAIVSAAGFGKKATE